MKYTGWQSHTEITEMRRGGMETFGLTFINDSGSEKMCSISQLRSRDAADWPVIGRPVDCCIAIGRCDVRQLGDEL